MEIYKIEDLDVINYPTLDGEITCYFLPKFGPCIAIEKDGNLFERKGYHIEKEVEKWEEKES